MDVSLFFPGKDVDKMWNDLYRAIAEVTPLFLCWLFEKYYLNLSRTIYLHTVCKYTLGLLINVNTFTCIFLFSGLFEKGARYD